MTKVQSLQESELFKIQKLINVLYQINRIKDKSCNAISIDAEKIDEMQHSSIIKYSINKNRRDLPQFLRCHKGQLRKTHS